MKTSCQAASFAAIISVLLSQFAAAGQLNPPGPPTAGTMKPLDVIEPRTPIRQSDVPLTISTSGSYYLAENLTASQTAVTITADDVTLDLCGFTIEGPDSGTCYGVSMYGRRNVEIRNGTIRDFSTGVTDTSAGSQDIRLLNLRLVSNLLNGIVVIGSNALVQNCAVTANGSAGTASQYGIRVGRGATLVGNKVYSNFNYAAPMVFCISAGEGSRIAGNTISRNGDAALAAFGIEARDGCVVTENSVYDIGDHATALVRGIEAADGCTITGNVISCNGTYSVDVWGIFCSVGCTIVRNTSNENGTSAGGSGNGIAVGAHCLVDQNAAYNNSGSNLLVRSDCTYGTNHAP